MKKTLAGIILFLIQISLAVFYNKTIDLVVILCVSIATFAYVLYKYVRKQYDQCEL